MIRSDQDFFHIVEANFPTIASHPGWQFWKLGYALNPRLHQFSIIECQNMTREAAVMTFNTRQFYHLCQQSCGVTDLGANTGGTPYVLLYDGESPDHFYIHMIDTRNQDSVVLISRGKQFFAIAIEPADVQDGFWSFVEFVMENEDERLKDLTPEALQQAMEVMA